MDIICGPLLDIFGRKRPVVIGFFISSIFILMVPQFTEVYPYFYMCRICIGCGSIIFMNVPILPDYVHPDSIGSANGITAIVVAISSLLTGTLML